MPQESSFDQYQVDLVKRRVYFQGEEIKIRPKSFELLQLFIENPKETINKERMLTTIWDDVNVDEQVIFQSIKELRKAFSTIDAIKTFPRKGYAWVGDVVLLDGNSLDVKNSVDNHASVHKEVNGNENIKFRTPLILLVFSALLLALFITFNPWSEDTRQDDQVKHIEGSIIVLPIKEHLNDRDHKWVSIGAMDQLIQRIPPAKNYGVMQVDDVFEIMKRARMPLKGFSPDDIRKIFVVSGAALIIETELTGTPGDYQLIYTLRRQQSIDRGVLITADVYSAIDQLAQIIATRLGTSIATLNTYHDKLANQLLAKALDKKIVEDYVGSEQYLKSLLEIEPANLKAKRLLAEISVYLKKTEQIKAVVASVEQLSIDDQLLAQSEVWLREFGRLKFWQGLNELQFGRTENARRIFEQANKVTGEAKDWLYLGYLAEAQGKLYRLTEQYVLAKKHFNLAIDNHQIIKCPFGEVNNLLNLAETAFLEKEYKIATNQAKKSLTIATQRELVELIEKTNSALEKYRTYND